MAGGFKVMDELEALNDRLREFERELMTHQDNEDECEIIRMKIAEVENEIEFLESTKEWPEDLK